MRPTSVAAPMTSLMSARHFRDGLAELHPVAAADALGALHRAAVQQRAVARAEVFDVHVSVAAEHARVYLRHEAVVEHDAAPPTSTHRHLVVQRERLTATRLGFQDAQA